MNPALAFELAVPLTTEKDCRVVRKSPAALAVVGAIRAYRLVFSARRSPCRFEPTCSAYGLEAVEVHGAARGLWLTARRIGRCRPGGGQGYDPVPVRESASSDPATLAALSHPHPGTHPESPRSGSPDSFPVSLTD